ncbi:MAG: DoxX family protein [Bryobacter sp.]|nr:DoxX family protein [Bryobacter sp.]
MTNSPKPAQQPGTAEFLHRLISTTAPNATILVRLMVGAVFLSEGIQKFLFPDKLGVGRFAKIGIPSPEVLAPFVGFVEITCGLMLLAGFLTRLAAAPMIIVMLVAITTTKLFTLPVSGFWVMAHEARTDWSMILGSVFLLIVGGGAWSVDAFWASRRIARSRQQPL